MLSNWTFEKDLVRTPPAALRVALRRFEMLSDHANPDRILDQMIVLEALFSDDKQEIAHKLSQRVANLIGTTPASRLEYFDLMKAGYKARSMVSHGDDLPTALVGIDDRMATVVRQALSRYIAYATTRVPLDRAAKARLLRALDDMCLGGPPIG